ncbi:MAG: hypothetical protein ABJB97_12500 [Acidobacteriota bacterium]
MRSIVIITILLLSTLVPGSAAIAQQRPEPPLTNTAVIKLVKAGFKEKTVIVIIRSRVCRFELDPDRLIELKRDGVSENVILAMLSQNESGSFNDDDWSDDSFFKDKGASHGNSGGGNGNTADIFGSSGGSKGETRSRGTSAGNEGQRMTTGSATVKIVRPPSEAGGATLKLEKTPTLTNEAIIQLVQAGFSEGTIIKRIEDSPGEFDLSPAKLDELRKRRVTDPIIAAMTTAMDGSVPKTPPGRLGEN